MKTLEDVQQSESRSGATLDEILRRSVYAQLPSRFYGMLQLCLPLAAQCWSWGWHRTAGWLMVASAFGLWALAQQQIDGYADAGDDRPLNGPRLGMAWRGARRMGGLVGSLTALALLLEGFAQVMAVVFKCPGCSG